MADFDFELPEEQIAQQPLTDRAASRMLVVDRTSGTWHDSAFREFPNHVGPGDCLVLNDSRVFASRLFATRSTGPARIEVFLIKPLTGDEHTWQALVRPGRKVAVGERLAFDHSLHADVIERGAHGERTIRFSSAGAALRDHIERIGHVPLPPYIRRADSVDDRSRYQTVYARATGSVAAPTAGLHFTPELLDSCAAKGAEIARVTLHVGLGTFAPLHVENVEDVRLHAERYSVDAEQLDRIRTAQRRIAVGTTAVRTLETVYGLDNGRLTGETEIFIRPGHKFRAVDAMVTNFHLPQSSLLMLVCAFAGFDLTMNAYRHAVAAKYRFFSYGDCMLIV